MGTEPVLRRCPSCLQLFRAPSGSDPFCSSVCSGVAAHLWVIDGLRRFAEANSPAPGLHTVNRAGQVGM